MIDSSHEVEDGDNEDKHPFRQSHINAWKRSGMSQADFCRRYDLNTKRLGYWKRKLVSKSEDVGFVPVSIKPSDPAP